MDFVNTFNHHIHYTLGIFYFQIIRFNVFLSRPFFLMPEGRE